MKIEGPSKSSPVKGTGKTGTKATALGGFSSLISDVEEQKAPAVQGLAAAVPLDALLSLQEALAGGIGEEAQRRARKHASDLLTKMEEMRLGILSGELDASVLDGLSRLVRQHREQVEDPALADILAEIDLRAQVELAKFGR